MHDPITVCFAKHPEVKLRLHPLKFKLIQICRFAGSDRKPVCPLRSGYPSGLRDASTVEYPYPCCARDTPCSSASIYAPEWERRQKPDL